jgi:Fe-S cluster assembly protein SufD
MTFAEIATTRPPTSKDEEWRYADIPALARLVPDALDSWAELTVAPGDTHRQVLLLDAATPQVQRLRVTVADGATCAIFAVNAAQDYARLEIEITLGEGAHFEFGGVTIGGGDAVREIVTRVTHAQPNATSHQVVRAVHWGQATGNFLGRIEVARHAQKTDAGQDFKGLLLERGASANARPELEIYADDVKCAHGASIGQMDEAARFYMASRGIDPDTARKLLIRAFIADALAAAGDDGDALLESALAALEGAAL